MASSPDYYWREIIKIKLDYKSTGVTGVEVESEVDDG